MQKKIVVFMCGFSFIAAMDLPASQGDNELRTVMTTYHASMMPHIERLIVLRMQLERNVSIYNIHGILRTLIAIRHVGFQLIRAYHRFDLQMHQWGIARPTCVSARQLLNGFVSNFAPWVSEQLDTFFSTYELCDIFVAEQVDWTEPFFALEMLLDEHGREEKPHVVEDEPCVGIDLIECSQKDESTATHKRLCCCLFK